MGILDGYQFDPSSYPGWLGAVLNSQPGQSQGFGDQLPANSAPAIGPALQGNPMSRAPAPPAPRDSGNPFMSLLNGIGGGLNSAISGIGNMVSGANGSPGLLDRLSAGAGNFTTGGNPVAGLLNSVRGLATGQRTDPAGLQMAQQGSTAQALYHAMMADGRMQPQHAAALAQAAALNPAVLKDLLPQLYSKPEFKTLKDAFGNERGVFVNPDRQTITEPGVAASPGTPANGVGVQGASFLAPGVKQVDSSLVGDDYLKQFSPELQQAVRARVEGRAMPTGNPRQGFTQTVNMIAQKYGADIGQPVDDVAYNERRKLRVDLASSSNNSMGGILSNGDSSFRHLAEAGESMVDLGNSSAGWNKWAQAKNYLGNAVFDSSHTAGQITALNTNLRKYGQESTKFYAGSGGGEAERLSALHDVNPQTASGEEFAAFLEKEKSLMVDRLNGKLDQIRQTLGPEEAQKIIAQKMPGMQKTMARIDAAIAKLRNPAPASAGLSFGPATAAQSVAQQVAAPPAPAIAALKAQPQLAAQFDAKYGQGAAARAMGQ